MRHVACSLVALTLAACGGDHAAMGERATKVDEQAALVDPARIESVLKGYVDREELVGVSAVVYEKGDEAYSGAFGMADREARQPMRRDTLVQIFSMTKPITGVLLMTFYEEGLFDLDDPLEKHLPEYAGIPVYAGEAGGEVRLEAPVRKPTVRDILRHTAGFANGDDGDRSAVGDRYRAAAPVSFGNTLDELSRALAGIPLLYQPGTRWYYGPSVDVQARLVEVLSGRPYDEVLRERLLDPLGMHDTGYTLRPDQHERMSALYERHADGSFTRVPDEEAFAFNSREWPLKPGGWGLVSTLDDYMRFARMLLDGGELDGVRILEPATVKLMATDAMPPEVTDRWWLVNKGQVGFGIDFAVRVAPPADQAEASGAVGEFFWDGLANTLFWIDPANDIAAVLFNQYVPFGKTEIQKDFRDAVYYREPTATALNKARPGPSSPRLSE